VSFHAGDGRRNSRRHPEDIAFVPLFVKTPGQRDGRVVERHVQTVDVLPMIAAALEIDVPWHVDGRPAFAGRESNRLLLDGVPVDVAALEARRDAGLAAQVAAFGSREPWERLHAIGPFRRLVGRSVSTFAAASASGVRVQIVNERSRAANPDSAVVGPYVSGRVTGLAARRHLAIALRGRIVAVTRTYADGENVEFSAMVPESALRPGRNVAEIHRIDADGGRVALAPLQ
jgi:hypothetical protein